METIWGRATDAIRKYGWRQGAYGYPDTGYCAVGALEVAVSKSELRLWAYMENAPSVMIELGRAKRRVREFLALGPKVCAGEWNDTVSIEEWNDTEGRTQEEVLALFQELHEKELAERGVLGAP